MEDKDFKLKDKGKKLYYKKYNRLYKQNVQHNH